MRPPSPAAVLAWTLRPGRHRTTRHQAALGRCRRGGAEPCRRRLRLCSLRLRRGVRGIAPTRRGGGTQQPEGVQALSTSVGPSRMQRQGEAFRLGSAPGSLQDLAPSMAGEVCAGPGAAAPCPSPALPAACWTLYACFLGAWRTSAGNPVSASLLDSVDVAAPDCPPRLLPLESPLEVCDLLPQVAVR